jgi:predicted dehydrogenase
VTSACLPQTLEENLAMKKRLNRRRMLQGTVLAGMGLLVCRGGQAGESSPNEKLNVAFIGVGGRGRTNLDTVASHGENIVALCDVDEQRAGDAFVSYPKARKYHDFRKMLSEMDGRIDAVVVSTPDHTHAVACAMAMKMGKHCYCEKPLTRTIAESRALAELSTERDLATQLGIQRHCWENYYRPVELVRAGTIGQVRECHVWISGNRGGGERPRQAPPIPPHLKWDLWLGPAQERPYHPAYVPYSWRFWWDFGTGETGNLGCHILDLPFKALSLGPPATVVATGPKVHPETTPRSINVRYEFPARGDLPPLTLTWRHGTKPATLATHVDPADWRWGVLFVGSRGMLLADLFHWKLLPESQFRDHPSAKWPKRKGEEQGRYEEWDAGDHYREWITACKTGSPTARSFDYGGALTEMVLLGNVAYRAGTQLEWDAASLIPKNCSTEAEHYINPPYRQGWTL